MENSEKMVEELTQKRKMTKNVIDKLDKRILANCFMAIFMMFFMCVVDIIYIKTPSEVSSIVFKVFAILLVIATIIIFETAYRKDSGKYAIYGIEFFIFSILVLYIPKIYENLEKKFCRELLIMPVFFAIYYLTKSIIIHFRTQKKYRDNLSDVKEIMEDKE